MPSKEKFEMGVPVSKEVEIIQKKRSRVIDNELAKEKRTSTVKLLLLGTSDCGKTTVLKQMKILHGLGFTETEIISQTMATYNNLISSMELILTAMNNFSIPFGNPERKIDAFAVCDAFAKIDVKINQMKTDFSSRLGFALKKLWSDSGVQECFSRGHQYHLHDSAKYFFDNIDRISNFNYVPNEQDILRTRVATTGIVEIMFVMNKIPIKVFDVGGQRSERRKWIHCFDDVNAVFYIASLSEYNMTLLEDDLTNRTRESLKLFNTLNESTFFQKTPFIVFFNKTDLFSEKIKQFPITIAFPDYDGPQTYEKALLYIELQYIKKNESKKSIYTHRTCATDTKSMEFVLLSCFDIVVNASLSKLGVL